MNSVQTNERPISYVHNTDLHMKLSTICRTNVFEQLCSSGFYKFFFFFNRTIFINNERCNSKCIIVETSHTHIRIIINEKGLSEAIYFIETCFLNKTVIIIVITLDR